MPAEGPRWIYGVHAVVRRLEVNPRSVQEVQLAPGVVGRVPRLRRLIADARIPLRESDEPTLRRLTGSPRHQGLAARTGPFQYRPLDELLGRRAGPLLMLDQIQDPHNLGALLRTAAATGVSGVLVPRHGAVGVTPTVEKVAAGAVNDVAICRVANLRRTLLDLKKAGYWSVGLMPGGGQNLFDLEVPSPWVLVLGGEQGLRPLVLQTCDFRASIPMESAVESLNASVAGAVAMYELRRQGGGGLTPQRDDVS